MSSLFDIGKSGLQSYRQSLAVTGQNIANINTDGYKRREANLEEIETVLALTNDDEDNLMVSVLVEKFSKDKRTMALINKPNYTLLQSSLNIDDNSRVLIGFAS